ncbi:hypothetical protein ABW20_dc0108726 [Dactylellina cionopaga]|nr:hypothetical protein ABW20_dc0108726 [Dactylellina cionopaga]
MGKAQATIDKINYNVPPNLPFPPNTHFTGRKEELARIDKYFDNCFSESASNDAPVICALTGTGGMGKTQIALEYAYTFRGIRRLTSIFWVSSATEETVRTSLVDIMQQIVRAQARASWPQSPPDYKAIAASLGITGLVSNDGRLNFDSDTIGNIRSALFDWFKLPGNRRWLLVFDNADNLEDFAVNKYFPNHGGGGVIVTSRRQDFSFCTKLVPLDGLDREDAVKLLFHLVGLRNPIEGKALVKTKRRVYSNFDAVDDTKNAVIVVEKLGFMPLAITHAGCFIQQTNIHLHQFLRYYDEAFDKVQSTVPRVGWVYRNDTALTTWEISFSEIQKQNEEAAILLLICSYLNPSEILEDLWEESPPNLESRLNNNDKFSLLASYSLITRAQGAFSIHPVVHNWARERMSGFDRLRIIRSAVKIVGMFIKLKDDASLSVEWGGLEGRKIVAHGEVLHKHLEPLFDGIFEHEQNAGEKVLALAGIHNIAMVLQNQRKFSEAMQWYQKALAGQSKTLGEDHPETLITVYNIGHLLEKQGKDIEAMQWYQKALVSEIKTLGEDHPSTRETIARVAILQAKLEMVVLPSQKALSRSRRFWKTIFPKPLKTKNNVV